MKISYDVAVIGAGAAGLLAAIRAAERGRRVVLLEKNPRPGVKILISGGTRCNVTNARPAREIVEAFGPNGRFLYPALGALDNHAVVRLLEDEGCATYVEDEIVRGKVFPRSNRATDVLGALLRRVERSGAALRTSAPVAAVNPAPEGGFALELPGGPLRAARVVVTTGGCSYPRSGTTGDGFEWARAFGHTIVPPAPALVPLVVETTWVRDLRGIALPARLRALAAGRAVAERAGPLLFTHFGLSGPVALDLSSPLARAPGYPAGAEVELDLAPGLTPEALDRSLRSAAAAGGARLARNGLPAAFPDRLADALIAAARVPAERRLAELARDERRRIIQSVKGLRLPVAGDRGYAMAEVTSGGVALDEIDPRTLESRRRPGLHFAGEVLDLDGPIGGFNFQAAWSTGWLAGSSV